MRLLAPLAQDLREYRLAIGRPAGAPALLLVDRPRRAVDEERLAVWRVDRWAPACRAVGLDPVPRPYDLRHSFASLLLAEGRQPTLRGASQLGHSSRCCSRTYAHLIDEFASHERIDAEAEIASARKARVLESVSWRLTMLPLATICSRKSPALAGLL